MECNIQNMSQENGWKGGKEIGLQDAQMKEGRIETEKKKKDEKR